MEQQARGAHLVLVVLKVKRERQVIRAYQETQVRPNCLKSYEAKVSLLPFTGSTICDQV